MVLAYGLRFWYGRNHRVAANPRCRDLGKAEMSHFCLGLRRNVGFSKLLAKENVVFLWLTAIRYVVFSAKQRRRIRLAKGKADVVLLINS
jgi:hypothetical protein